MKRRQVIATLVTLGLASGASSAPSALAAPAPGPAVLQSASPVATPSNLLGSSAPGESIDFSVGLQPSDPAAAADSMTGLGTPASGLVAALAKP
ncbi:MAG: hypothetical protein H0X28_12265 [Solirubrobacterales bacterium]|nr:hypothetical protein [Solirubrobacterales bacterium]